VWSRFLRAAADGGLFVHAGVTLLEIAWAGVRRPACDGDRVLRGPLADAGTRALPYLVASQAVPLVAIAPLLVIWFGPGMFSKVLICGLIVFFPVLVTPWWCARRSPALHDLMRSYHARGATSCSSSRCRLRCRSSSADCASARPSRDWRGGGRACGRDRGLGFLINVGRGQYDTALVFVSLFTLVALALMLYACGFR